MLRQDAAVEAASALQTENRKLRIEAQSHLVMLAPGTGGCRGSSPGARDGVHGAHEGSGLTQVHGVHNLCLYPNCDV